jgi:hypothetical protein
VVVQTLVGHTDSMSFALPSYVRALQIAIMASIAAMVDLIAYVKMIPPSITIVCPVM